MKAYIGRIRAKSGHLLGGGKVADTFPFELESDAAMCATIKEQIEKSVGHDVEYVGIRETQHSNPIRHSEVV